MKKISRGRIRIHQEDLIELFNIPEGVIITALRLDEYGYIYMEISSTDPIDKVTYQLSSQDMFSTMRILKVPLKKETSKENNNEK